jgi:hypothetical protein
MNLQLIPVLPREVDMKFQWQSMTCVERMVFESIQRGHRTLTEIMSDTQLNLYSVNVAIECLIGKSLICFKNHHYIVNKQGDVIQEKLNSPESVKHEYLELLHELLQRDRIFQSTFYLSPKDKPIFKALLKNLENFIRQLPPAPQHIPLADYEYYFWGGENYGKAIQQLLKGH